MNAPLLSNYEGRPSDLIWLDSAKPLQALCFLTVMGTLLLEVTTSYKEDPDILQIHLFKSFQHSLTRHVWTCHNSSAAVEHDSKHSDKTHHGTSGVVYCVFG